jgi:hypothetical protein
MHEQALVGLTARVGDAFGSFDEHGHYAATPPGSSEVDLEQDVFGAIRFLKRGQAALLVPLVETRRQTRTAGSELGGGAGDVNPSARYDFVLAGEHRIVPGIGLLAGITAPTGTPVESASKPQATDATGVGAFQGNLGLAFEQAVGRWLFNATLLAAKRTSRTVQNVHSTLGTQLTVLAGAAYSFDNDAAIAFVASYAFEGDATVAGADVPSSGRRLMRWSGAGVYPLTDRLRVTGSVYVDPPIAHVGQNQLTTVGLTLGALFAWL